MRKVLFIGASIAAAFTMPTALQAQVPEKVIIPANPQGPGTPITGAPNPQTSTEPVPPAVPADPGYQAGPYKGALTPPPPAAMNKVYPVCTRHLQDSCRNPGGR